MYTCIRCLCKFMGMCTNVYVYKHAPTVRVYVYMCVESLEFSCVKLRASSEGIT